MVTQDSAASDEAELTIIIVSYNTRELTLACLRSIFEHRPATRFQIVLIDNASSDGSAEAIRRTFPDIKLIASKENLGFAHANNVVVRDVRTEWLLLLNPDTEVQAGSIDNLLRFSKNRPQAGITGGRTVFPDGTLNPASCWMAITLWSTFCLSTGLTAAFRSSTLFNPEGMGAWQRDSIREVDIVSGCFFMIRRSLWNQLGGFNAKYFMYGEEADLCLRAKALGYRPAITPDAQIMHVVGASSVSSAEKAIRVLRARATLIRDHWPVSYVKFGLGLMLAGAGMRALTFRFASTLTQARASQNKQKWTRIWTSRKEWLAGF